MKLAMYLAVASATQSLAARASVNGPLNELQ